MDKSKWHLRPGTQDEFIYNEVYVDNCYRLPESMSGICVVDIGANIGAFAIACLERGAEHIWCYEPDPTNFDTLLHNVAKFDGKVTLDNAFVVGVEREGKIGIPRKYAEHDGVFLTGGVSSFVNCCDLDSYLVPAVKLFDVRGVNENMRVWIKVDCEGAEHEILSCDLPWDRIERIFGEVHHYRDGKFSRDTEKVQFTPAGDMDGTPQSLANRLSSAGYNVDLYPNPDDDRLSLFFAERSDCPLVTWHLPETESYMSVCVLTPFRNATANLKRYFSQLSNLRDELKSRGVSLRLVAAEGDSTDNTRERIIAISSTHGITCQTIDTTHGQMKWGSVEDPRRMQCMSDVMNKALDAVREADDIVVWIMSDLEWKTDDIVRLIDQAQKNEKSVYAPLALNGDTDLFYDTWAYRYNESRLGQLYPYHKDFVSGVQEVHCMDSAGTCLVMDASIARTIRATDNEAVSFCAQARAQGYSIHLSFDSVVRHKRSESKRMLYIGDIIAPTGFGRVTQALLPEFASQGYEIDIVGVNYHGQPHNMPYRIWPANVLGQSPFGEIRAKQLLSAYKYDIIFWLGDPWNVSDLLDEIRPLENENKESKLPPIVSYITVDTMNHDVSSFEHLAHVICCTRYGANELFLRHAPVNETMIDTNPPCSVVPFGVNHNVYHPRERQESRRAVTNDAISSEAFIIGFVGKNQPRKRLDLALEIFSYMTHTYDIHDAYIYFVCGPEINGSIDIGSLARFYGLEGKVLYNNQVLSDDIMAQMYSAFDVLLSTSQGEGFGLTTLEAMACGVPCVVPDNSAYGTDGWIENEAIKIPCTSKSIMYGPGQGQMLGALGEVIDVELAAQVLYDLYTSREMRDEYSKRGIRLASKLSWQDTASKVAGIVNSVLEGD